MIPTLGLVRFGRKDGLPVPVPFLLLWPIIALAWPLLWAAERCVPARGRAAAGLRAARIGAGLLWHLSGLRVDVRSAAGETVRLRLL